MLCQTETVEHPATQRDQSQVMYDTKLEAKTRAYAYNSKTQPPQAVTKESHALVYVTLDHKTSHKVLLG